MIEFFRAPEGDNVVSVPASNKGASCDMTLPANLWCFFVVTSFKDIPREALNYSAVATLSYAGGEVGQGALSKREGVLPYSRFVELVADALQENFLSLELWKKIDSIEEYLQANIPFVITNPVARQIEGYSSVLLSCGDDAIAVADKVIAKILLPQIFGSSKEQINHEGKTFPEHLDGLFGLDNLPVSHKVVTENGWA